LDEPVVDEPQVKRVNVDFPEQIVAKLDRHAAQMGITRQSLIKVWIFERLKDESAKRAIDHAHFLSFEQRLQAALDTNLLTGADVDLRSALRRFYEATSEKKMR